MFARFDENPAMNLQDIKETKRYGRTHARTDNVKTVYPLQTKFAGGYKEVVLARLRLGHTRVTLSYLLLGEEQPQCVGCDAPFTVRHFPFGVWRFCTSEK